MSTSRAAFVAMFVAPALALAAPVGAPSRPTVLFLPVSGVLGQVEGEALRRAEEGVAGVLEDSRALKLKRVTTAEWATAQARLDQAKAAATAAQEALFDPDATPEALDAAAESFLLWFAGADSLQPIVNVLPKVAAHRLAVANEAQAALGQKLTKAQRKVAEERAAEAQKRLRETLGLIASLEGPDALPAEPAALVAEVRAATQGSARLRVETFPAGAAVTLDGKVLGSTPLEIDRLVPGEHVLKVLREGFGLVAKRFTVAAGAVETVNEDLSGAAKAPVRALVESARTNDAGPALEAARTLGAPVSATFAIAAVLERVEKGHVLHPRLVRLSDGQASPLPTMELDLELLGVDVQALEWLTAVETQVTAFATPAPLAGPWVASPRALEGVDGVQRVTLGATQPAPKLDLRDPALVQDATPRDDRLVVKVDRSQERNAESGSVVPWVVGGVVGAAALGTVLYFVLAPEPAATHAAFTVRWP